MADSLEDLGAISLWKPNINWREELEYNWDIERQILEFEGTSQDLITFSQEKPHHFNFTVTCMQKADEFALLQKFIELRGRVKNFWFPNPINLFTLKEEAPAGTNTLLIELNNLEFRGYERIYFILKNKDRKSV